MQNLNYGLEFEDNIYILSCMFSIQSMNVNYIFNSIHQPRSSLLISNSLPVLLESDPNELVFMLNTES